MSEVTKLYENAGVELQSYCCDESCGEPTKRCKDCPDYHEVYPPFTAEKQLEIIVFLVKKGYTVTFANFSNNFLNPSTLIPPPYI